MSLLLRKIVKVSQVAACQQTRKLNIQENISHSLLNEYGIKTPKFCVANSAVEAEKIACGLMTKNFMVKAQVLAGGRGLGTFKNGFKGGVHSATSANEVKLIAYKMIGQKLVTKQTGPEGRICNSVMVAERKFSRREFYFAIALEREFNGPVLIASSKGGVNIEDVARESPEEIVYLPINQCKGLTPEAVICVVKKVGIQNTEETAKMLCNLYALFVDKDALLVENNPYVEDVCLNYCALDAKLKFDDSAEFRQPEIFAMRDLTQEDPKEVAATKQGLNYVSLDGSIGCMVNGAGLAMATMDILKLHGGSPANFLDVGGSATADAVKEAIGIIMLDPRIRTIFVNIYGGIMRCDTIVEGLLNAVMVFDFKVPVVVRLQGNKADVAKKMIREAGCNVITCDDFDEAAKMAVRCSKIAELADAGDLESTLKMKLKSDGKNLASDKTNLDIN